MRRGVKAWMTMWKKGTRSGYMQTPNSDSPNISSSATPHAAQYDEEECDHQEQFFLLGFNITHLSETTQFLLFCVAVFAIFLGYSYTQELIFHYPGYEYGTFMSIIQMAVYAGMAYAAIRNHGPLQMRAPLQTYLLLAVLHSTSLGFSNASIEYINYPTQIIFKSSKIVPVMIGGVLVLRKSFTAMEYVAGACVSVGLAVFTLADATVSPAFDYWGVFLISIALVADTFLGNFQEKAMRTYRISENEVVFYEYFLGIWYMIAVGFMSSQIVEPIEYCMQYPSVAFWLLVFSALGYIGTVVVMTMIRKFGAVVTVIVTSVRKMFSMGLSFIIFPKPFSMNYIYGTMLVFLGVAISTYIKRRKVPAKAEMSSLLEEVSKQDDTAPRT
eukprot:TRINITY_DN3906_c0_g1_i3.p1 TRINITY_DN3906_c0_g1~~TRINITY_DN3906_c0_g1_i3.p1  ORF type:complete len:385 (+),score=76.63 TRINITY_DN3906_c0_g1_i3:51-1205(+)